LQSGKLEKGLTKETENAIQWKDTRIMYAKPRSCTYPGSDSVYFGEDTFEAFHMTVTGEQEVKVEKLRPIFQLITNDPE
jgi:hypothetical protein